MITPPPNSPSPPSLYYSTTAFNLLAGVSALYSAVSQLAFLCLKPFPTLRIRIPALPPPLSTPKVAIVTGSNTGIGYETANALIQRGYEVVLACRSRDKALQALEKLNGGNPPGKATFVHPLDLASFESVKDFSKAVLERYDGKLDLLINNAGRNTSGPSGKLDLCYQTNFLGHFVLTKELMPAILKAKGRIVNLASVMHHFCADGGDVNTVEYWRGSGLFGQKPIKGYSPSKLAAILFTIELNRRFREKGVRSFAVNPGAVNSDIWRGTPAFVIAIFRALYLTNRQGCYTSVAAAMKDDFDDGVIYLQPYWQPNSATPFPLTEMLGPFCGYMVTEPRLPADGGAMAATSMWKASEELTKCKFD